AAPYGAGCACNCDAGRRRRVVDLSGRLRRRRVRSPGPLLTAGRTHKRCGAGVVKTPAFGYDPPDGSVAVARLPIGESKSTVSQAEILGQRLREAREAKELSLDETERATRIRARFLDALERGDYSMMTPVQAQGFLRNYAR